MTLPESESHQSQAQDISIGGNFQVDGQGNTVDFSQTHVDFSQATISHTEILQVAFDEIKTRPLIARSPYIGLRKFEVRDKDLFFGRDRLITHLQNRLQKHFLLVLGASGSGKSSLMRAGLIPRLAEQRGGSFRELLFTPDQNPFESFRASLINAGYRQSVTEFVLSRQSQGLVEAAQTVKQADEEWLIFVDQFEELFTLCQDLQQRQHFIDALIQVVKTQPPMVDIVLAMRADFLDRFSAYPRLRGVLQRSELVTDLGDDELRLAIEQPAARHGVVFEPGLVEEIIQGLKGSAEGGKTDHVSLPLLQYTLKLLWESSGDLGDRLLRTQTYRQLGGVQGALQRRVDDIYRGLSAAEQAAAKHIFLRLVDTTSADAGTTAVGKAVSHRAALKDFRDATEQKVLQELINASLLISDRPRLDNSSAIVELAHETLIDSWDLLKSWIEESKPLLRLKHQLQEDASRWQKLCQQHPHQAEAELWQGSKLQRLLAQKAELPTRFGEFRPEESAFIQACETLAEREQRREIRRLRRTIVGVGLSLAAMSGLAGLAAFHWIQAEQGQIQALSRTSQAEFTLNRDTFASLRTALNAGHRLQQMPAIVRPDDLPPEVMTALAQGMYWVQERNRLEAHTAPVEAVAFNPMSSGTLDETAPAMATVSYDQTLKLWNSTGQLLGQVSHDRPILSVDFSPDGQAIASADDSGQIKLWTADGDSIASFSAHDNWIHSVRFRPHLDQMPEQNLLASSSADGYIKLWNLRGDLQHAFLAHEQSVREIDFHPSGQVLATASEDGTLKLWDLPNPAAVPLPIGHLIGHQEPVISVRFSPDGNWLASSDNSGIIRIWKATGEPVRQFASSDGSAAYQLAFSPDSRYLAGALSQSVTMWDLQGNVIDTLQGHLQQVKGVSFSPDGKTLASASQDTTVKLWNFGHHPQLRVLEFPAADTSKVIGISVHPSGQQVAATRADGQVALWHIEESQARQLLPGGQYGISVQFSPQGDRLASSDFDGTIRFWTDKGEPLPPIVGAHSGGVYGLSFSPNGDLLASGDGDGTIYLWDVSNGTFVRSFSGHQGRVHWLSFDAAGSRLASASNEETVKIWNLASDQPVVSLVGHEGRVWSVAFSPQGDAIATAGGDGTVKLWANDGELIETLSGHLDSVNAVQFSADGRFLFSASNDQTIRVWQRDGTLLVTLVGHTGVINGLQWSHTSAAVFGVAEAGLAPVPILISGSSDGRVILWNLENFTLNKLMRQGCDWLSAYHQSHHAKPQRLCD